MIKQGWVTKSFGFFGDRKNPAYKFFSEIETKKLKQSGFM